MARKALSFRLILTLVLTLGILILGVINVRQKRVYVPPEDGVAWLSTGSSVLAQSVAEDGPAFEAGIRSGDILLEINERPIRSEIEVPQSLYPLGVWSKVNYLVQRDGKEFSASVVVEPAPVRVQRQRLYLEIIGSLYFLIGALVVVKRSRAAYATHFYFVCLTSFVLYVFHSTGKLNDFDWTVFWFDIGAYLLLPALFLHFCLRFPAETPWFASRRGLYGLLYLPGAAIFLTWVAFVTGALRVEPSQIVFRQLLDTVNDFHLGLYFIVSAAVLFYTYRSVHTPEMRQQLRWVTRGTTAAVVPYFFLHSVPRFLGFDPPAGADIAVLPMALIPLAFGYAIHRYRLMDVDIIFKAGVAYTLATLSVIGLYAALVALVGEFMGSGVGAVARVSATIVAAILFAPIKDKIQVALDKFFYRERYEARRTLSDFGRTLGSEIHPDRLMERIVEWLCRSFMVSRVAVFVVENGSERFVPSRLVGLQSLPAAGFDFLSARTPEPFLNRETAVHDLHHFVPCRTKDKIIAYLAIGRTDNGDYLTSEDMELVVAVAGYIGIALDNARLYQSIELRAIEYQNLKDFSESIVESINVGVLVEDLDHRVVGWNQALERLTGRRKQEVLGQPTERVLPAELLSRVVDERFVYRQHLSGHTVNLSATPLLDKAGRPDGTLIIVDDITDRVRLEDQLVQNEKLTSIGLLAAGVAHEINTPLAVISTYAQLLRKEISPEDSRSKLLEKITRQTFRASEIVNSLLNFSRTAATDFAETDLHQVIRDTLSLIEHQLKRGGVHVHCDLSADMALSTGNSGKLQQVFLNLFMNAKDAMPQGGLLSIETLNSSSGVVVRVRDSGSGIDSEDLKRIYDPFFTTKAAGKGTGLGLAVSYGIIQEHGGSISAESEVGVGTCFKLELPMSRKSVHV